MFTNHTDLCVDAAHDPLLTCDPYHPTLTIEIEYNGIYEYLRPKETFRFNYRMGDFGPIFNYFNMIHWDNDLNCLNLNDAVDRTYNHLYKAIELYVPKYRISV